MNQELQKNHGTSRKEEENYLKQTLAVVYDNVENYGKEVRRMQADIDEMLEHFHDDNMEVLTLLNNTITLHDHMKRALIRNEKAMKKPYFGRIDFLDQGLNKKESIYIGKGGISRDATHWMVVDWRAPAANAYYENGLGPCSYLAPKGVQIDIDLLLKRTYEMDEGRLLDFYDSEVIANDELLTRYLAKNKQAVLGEIIATIQKEQNDIIRKSPYHNMIVQGVAGSGKTTVAMHRISYILYNYQDIFRPDDFYIVGSNRILLNYITGVLPDLDVHGVRQMTMEQLFTRLLYEDWDEKKYRIISTDQTGEKGSIKGTSGWFSDLEQYCSRLEWDSILRKSIYLNPREFVEGFKNGKTGVHDESNEEEDIKNLVLLIPGDSVERYIRENPLVSIQSKIDMLNDRLLIKIKDEFLGKGVKYTEAERKAILKAYRGRYGAKVWKRPIFDLYREFLAEQATKGIGIAAPTNAFDVYDLAALAYLYKRVRETEQIREAHHIVIDEAQDFGMMAYLSLKFCIRGCSYTIMGDVSQNIRFGYGLNDWEELKEALLSGDRDSFGVLKKSYRNTVEISEFAIQILHHGQFSMYPVEPIIRHGDPVRLEAVKDRNALIRTAADIVKEWRQKGLDTIAVVCRDQESASGAAEELGRYVEVMESDLEKAVFGSGIMVLPVEFTKGLEFDAVLILNPTRKEYPGDDGHARLLYVAATRALHELCVLHTGGLTGLIADPVPERKQEGVQEKKRDSIQERKRDAVQEKKRIGVSAGVLQHNREAATGAEKRQQRPGTLPTGKNRAVIVINSAENAGLNREREERGHSLAMTRNRQAEEMADNTYRMDTMENQKRCLMEKADTLRPQFGDMPGTDKLRPPGHARIDLAVRWVEKKQDGLYIQSRYGILRLSPIGSAIVRVTFTREQQITDRTNESIAVRRTDRAWFYRDQAQALELMTDELCLRVDKAAGSIQYMTRDKKLLLAEQSKECRQIERGAGAKLRTWLYLDWQKNENLYATGTRKESGLKLRGTARYISDGPVGKELPFLISDKGYGILMATDKPVLCCDVPAYGSYLYTEGDEQLDYYFIGGKKQNTILNACGYLLGKL